MVKTEVIVDTEFIHKLSSDGKKIQELKKVLDQLDFKPVIHPYVATSELDMFSYFKELVGEGYVRIACYEEFLSDDNDAELYSAYFQELHDRLREYLEAERGHKRIAPLCLPKGKNIFEYRKAGMSLGDVHMVLMASFAHIPVILSDDGDMEVLKIIAQKSISYEGYELTILNCVEVLLKIAEMKSSDFSKAELLEVLKHVGENNKKSVIKQTWNLNHPE